MPAFSSTEWGNGLGLLGVLLILVGLILAVWDFWRGNRAGVAADDKKTGLAGIIEAIANFLKALVGFRPGERLIVFGMVLVAFGLWTAGLLPTSTSTTQKTASEQPTGKPPP
jgi:hypothetical protein